MAIMIVNPSSATSENNSVAKAKKTNSNDFSAVLSSASTELKANSLDDIFQKASQKYNVPVNLLKAVAKVESNFKANAKSSCGAMGIMQLMPSTAKSLGVRDPYDAEQNIMGGAKFISQLLKRFDGNTKLALAAYNAGPGNVIKYSGIPPFKETQNYVVKVMGYMGNNLQIDNHNTNFIPKSKPINEESSNRNLNSEEISSENDFSNGEYYAQLMNIYKYQMQINFLSDSESDDNITDEFNLWG